MRELKRSIARANMKRLGVPHINRKKKVEQKNGKIVKKSFFSLNWRDFVGGIPKKYRKPTKTRKGALVYGR